MYIIKIRTFHELVFTFLCAQAAINVLLDVVKNKLPQGLYVCAHVSGVSF